MNKRFNIIVVTFIVKDRKILRVVYGLNHMLHACTNLSQFLMNFNLAVVVLRRVFNSLNRTPVKTSIEYIVDSEWNYEGL